jgi:hypothetical protein
VTAKTQKQIDAMVARMKKLRPKVLPFSVFSDNNLKTFDMVVSVLEERKGDDDIAVLMDHDYDVWSVADNAIKWMRGEEVEEAPDEGWPTR